MEFTPTTLENVKATGKRHVISCTTREGLAIKVSALGRAAYYYRWKERGQRKEVLLSGTFAEVLSQYEYYKAAALANSRQAALRKLPAVLPANAFMVNITLPELVDKFHTQYVQRHLSQHSQKNYLSFTNRLLKAAQRHPFYEGKASLDESRVVIKKLLRTVRDAEGHPVLCNRMRSCFSKLFSWAEEEDLIVNSPMWGMPTAPDSKAKSTHLQDSELRVWLKVLADGEYNEATKDALKLILLTGMRSGEVLGLQREQILYDKSTHQVIRLEDNMLWLPETKNGSEYLIPLVPAAREIIERRMVGKHPQSRLFPTSSFGLRQVSCRTSKRANTTVVTPHDLRRTFAIMAQRLGIEDNLIPYLLNHTLPSVTNRHYAIYKFFDERRVALEKIAGHLVELGPL